MKVAEVMTTRVVTIEMDDRLTVVKDILDSAPFHHLLVIEDDLLQGVISERDLLKALSPYLGTHAESVRDTATVQQRAHQIMSRSPISISPSQSVEQALNCMLDNKIGCLPVLDNGKIEGIFTWYDGVRFLLKR